jgi:predicted ABC-type transport system involved in lysophospholipase L1 biosynthesis ATPase subunit
MNSPRQPAQGAAADATGVALAYIPPKGETGGDGRLWIASGGDHRVRGIKEDFKSRLLAAVLDMKPQKGVRLVVLGADVGALKLAERAALRARIAFLPANGGLISTLNGWENIALPSGYHDPKRLPTLAPQVYALLEGLGAEVRPLLARLPEEMTLYEKKLVGYVRILLEAPELVLVEDLSGGLEAGERAQADGFAAAYRAGCPDGSFIHLESAPEE